MEQISAVRAAFGDDLKVPMNFVKTVPVYNPAKPIRNAQQPQICINPQTTELCTKLGITDPCVILSEGTRSRQSFGGNADVSMGEDDDPTYTSFALDSSVNPDEISLDEDDSDGGTNENHDNEASATQNRTRLSLSLPPVKGGESSSSDLPVGDITSPFKDPPFPDLSDSSLKDGLTTSTPLVPRVIKRRNLDIYSSQQDESVGGGDTKAPTASADSVEEKAGDLGGERKQETGGRQIKKIKRRNQAMYTADDDDE